MSLQVSFGNCPEYYKYFYLSVSEIRFLAVWGMGFTHTVFSIRNPADLREPSIIRILPDYRIHGACERKPIETSLRKLTACQYKLQASPFSHPLHSACPHCCPGTALTERSAQQHADGRRSQKPRGQDKLHKPTPRSATFHVPATGARRIGGPINLAN